MFGDVITNASSSEYELELLLHDDLLKTIVFVNAIISAVIGLAGVVFNLINITVFIKMGFGEFTNISLLCLAVADVGSLMFLSGVVVVYNPLMLQTADADLLSTMCYLTVAVPHVCFSEISGCCNVVLALERFLCIAVPHRVKSLVTSKRVVLVNVFIFVYIIVVKLIGYIGYGIPGTTYNSPNNSTAATFGPTALSKMLDSISTIIDNFTQLTTFPLMIGITAMKIRIFKKATSWRLSVTSSSQGNTMSKRETKLSKIVITISIVYIVCNTPPFLATWVMFLIPDFSLTGSYREVFIATFTVLFNIDAINSIMPFLIYLNMSTKFKETVKTLTLNRFRYSNKQ
ncbi:lysophosphatidic acid receptor 6 [Biomphalaria glabrata]|nr:lysophosphatidic acid receptor 6 [Biomphalaria glabrata]